MAEPTEPHDRADNAVAFFQRCLARGLSRSEAVDLTVAYLLAHRGDPDREPPEPWRK